MFLLILLRLFTLGVGSVSAVSNNDFSVEDLDKFIYINNTDAKNILRTIPQVLTDTWIESVVSVASAEKEAASMIVRKSVRDNIRDYLLIEGPKEVGIEIAKLGYKVGKVFFTQSIGEVIKEIEKLTVEQAVNYLGQWLKENEVKVATGNLDFSYNNFQGKKEKQQFQYIIFYYPETDNQGEAVIKIFSSEPIGAPESRGSWGSLLGTGWNYSTDYAQGKKIAPFVLTIRGEMDRERAGYWQSEITHSYSWKSQPNIQLEFPDNVPYFDFHEKGFFEKLGDTIKNFFGRIGDFFSGASVVDVPDIENNQDGTLDMSADSALGQFIANILEQFRAFKSFLSQAEYNALEEQAQDIVTEDDLLAFMEKIESLQEQLDALGERINLLQVGGGISSGTAEFDPGQDQQTGQNILINEVCAGLNKAQNEFIEIYNPNNAPIELSDANFQLQLVNSSNNITKKKITWNKNIIPAKGYFLLIGGELIIDNKKVQGDAVFSAQLSSVSGVIVSDNEGNILDKVSWGKPEQSAPQSAVEAQGKILQKGLETNKSLERSNHIDTNNNAADFSLNESPSPTNSKGEIGLFAQEQTGSFLNSGAIGDTGAGSASGSSGGSGGSGSGGHSSIPSPKILISEVQIEGETKGQDFIELYNPSSSSVDISGWRLRKRNQNGAESSIRIFPGGSAIPGEGYFLWAGSKDENYPSSVGADTFSTSYLIQDESVALLDQGQNIIDAVAWGTGHNSPFVEGQAFGDNPKSRDMVGEWLDGLGFTGARTPYPHSIFYQSLGRKAIGSGGYQDTDNNSEDFEIQEPTSKSKNKSFIEPVLEDILKEIDDTSPETEITSGPPLLTNQTQAIFIFHANEENCSFECKLDSQDWESCESPKVYPGLYNGQHKFLSKATDLFLNTDLTPAEYAWAIDTAIESPNISLFDIDTYSEFYTNQRIVGVTVSASSTEEGSEWFLSEDPGKPSVDDPDWQNEKPEIFALSEADGSKTVYVWSKDMAGNISPLGNSSSIILDTLAPLSQVLELDVSQSSANFIVTWSGSDESGIADYDIQFKDGLAGSWQDWQIAVQGTSADFSGADSHAYYFRSRAVDLAGNIEAWSEAEEGDTFSYVNLSGPPLPEIISPNDGDSFSPSDDVDSEAGGVQILIEGTARSGDIIILDSQEILVDENNEWQITVTLVSGQNTINIRAQDADGDQSGLVTIILTLTESLEENVFAQDLIISEVRSAGSEEFVELYNPLEQEFSLSGFYFSYFSAGRDWNNPFLNKEFPTSTSIIQAKEYFLVGMGDYSEEESDWKPYQTHLSDEAGAAAVFSCNPGQATTTQAAIDCKIDALGWGEPLVFETQAATSSSDKSLARKLSPDRDGYLRYIDTNDNSNDFEEQEPSPKQRNFSLYSDLDNDGIIDEYDPLTEISQDIALSAGEYVFKDLVILEGINLFVNSDISLEPFKGVKIIADNITIDNSAGILADGNGYLSDQGPGVSFASQTGASHGGIGGRNGGDPRLFIYGDLEFPADLGSGALGNPEVPGFSTYRRGGAGGGAIILDVQGELLNNGLISANGEDGLLHSFGGPASTGAGSGGSVYITTSVLSGTGIIRANGGGSSSGSGAGGGGRVAIYYDANNFTGNIQAFGGEDADNVVNGGPGTVFMSQGETGNLVIDNNGRNGAIILSNDSYIFSDIAIKGGANFYLPNQLSCANLDVQDSVTLIASDDTAINIGDTFGLSQSQLVGQNQKIVTMEGNNITLEDSEITANILIQSNSLAIDSGSAISSAGLGYLAEEGPGAGIIAYGGSYGGLGGRNYPSSGFGQPYGDEQMPDDFGSGGGNSTETRKGGNGGGKIKITIAGEIIINGVISSNGDNGIPHTSGYPASGAGSGGTIYLSAGAIEGAGTISANGGSASSISGGGGGGRIAIYGNMGGFTGVIAALGGANSDNASYSGKDGTVFLSP